jgi:hypothetical protein
VHRDHACAVPLLQLRLRQRHSWLQGPSGALRPAVSKAAAAWTQPWAGPRAARLRRLWTYVYPPQARWYHMVRPGPGGGLHGELPGEQRRELHAVGPWARRLAHA